MQNAEDEFDSIKDAYMQDPEDENRSILRSESSQEQLLYSI
jgi:hypothetical protein